MIEHPPELMIKRNFARPSAAQINAFQGVPTGFVCDAMQGKGALSCTIRPLTETQCKSVVAPAIVADNGPAGILATMAALHILEPGDIVVACVHGHSNCSAIGDQFSGMLANKGAAGFITDGQVRDADGILQTGLPVWCAGLSPNSPYASGPARVGFSASIGGHTVSSGDLIVADRNGVVVVPLSQIDTVVKDLEKVGSLEADLERNVGNGYCEVPMIEEMITDGRAVIVD